MNSQPDSNERQRRRRVAAISVPLALLGVFLLGCARSSGTPSVRPSAAPGTSVAISASPAVTNKASQSPDATPSSTAEIVVDTVVLAAVDGIRVRTAPGLSSGDLGASLMKGTGLFVVAGPVSADGYTWYHVTPFDVGVGGWAASAALDGTRWLVPHAMTCPTPPLDGQAVLNLGSYGGLVCFGGHEIQLLGGVRCKLADVDRVYAGPTWLRTDRHCDFDLLGQSMEVFDGGIKDLVVPRAGRALVTGHFDDPQATSCVNALLDPPRPDPSLVVLNCRSMFVATDLKAAP
jgi:hypothetical protein